jgi:hypothetical protein
VTLAATPPFLGKWPVILFLFVVGVAALVAMTREGSGTPEPAEAKEGART